MITHMINYDNIEHNKKQYENKSITELRHIIRNKNLHTQEEIIAADETLKNKIIDWKFKNIDTVNKIDNQICNNDLFEFHVFSFDGYKLSIVGSSDFSYYHKIEIIFEDVFFFSGFFNGWQSDTSNNVFLIPENENDLNIKFEIEADYQLFTFKTEDYNNDIIIGAKNISFNNDIVYYYNRPNLQQNERIADFIKNKKTKKLL